MYAQQGISSSYWMKGRLWAIFLWTRKRGEIQEAMVLPEYEELLMEQAPECRPAIMGRIVHLPQCFP
ncbi:MAG: hypothetical protein ACLRXA_23975 [Clostridium sp.]